MKFELKERIKQQSYMSKTRSFINKIFYAISANLLSLIVSVLTTLLVPRFLGNDIEQYGYLQIYLFYITYLGMLHFGWCDGIFLRDGGKEYKKLNKSLYSCQFWLFTCMELVISFVIIAIGFCSASNSDYLFVFVAVALNVFIFLPRTMLQYFLQTTNRIKEYAAITMLGRALYGCTIIIILIGLSRNYKWFILGDIMGKTVALFYSLYLCRDIVFSKPCNIKNGIKEAVINVRVGINLTFANIASMLITGIVRWGIQQNWDVATYGKISLTLNVSSLIMTFISAIAIVLYPTLKRIKIDRLPTIYSMVRSILMLILLALMIAYYPMETILINWLPQYTDSLHYMAILFPMCIYSAKMTLLIQTYMNVFRLEKYILRVNLVGVLIAGITTFFSITIFNSLTCAMVSIVINQMLRCIIAEIVLASKIKIHVFLDIVLEMILTVLFIVSSWFIGGWSGVVIYIIGYIIYLIIKRKDIFSAVMSIKKAE